MRYGMYDATRGLTIAVAAGLAGLLVWTATQVGQTSTGRFWAEMGIVAGAGLVLSLAQVLGGWTKGMRLRLSPGTFVLGFVPVLVCVGWILMASQPGTGWHEGRIVSWSHSIGLMGVIHAVGLWNGVLAFGFGLVPDEDEARPGCRRRRPPACRRDTRDDGLGTAGAAGGTPAALTHIPAARDHSRAVPRR